MINHDYPVLWKGAEVLIMFFSRPRKGCVWVPFGSCQAMNVKSLATILELVSMREGEQKHPIYPYLFDPPRVLPYISPELNCMTFRYGSTFPPVSLGDELG